MQLPTRVVVAVLIVMVGLLVVVVVVGLIRDQVDTNGLAIVLAPIISGILLGTTLRFGRTDKDKS